MDKRFGLIIILATVILTACNTSPKPTDNTPVLGEFDSTSIAGDTVMQAAIESSYEYNNSLNIGTHEVYDVVASGAPAHGELWVIHRDAQNLRDTIIKTPRTGIVVSSYLTDLNKNKQPEVIVVLQNRDSKKLETLVGYEIDKDLQADTLKFSVQLPNEVMNKYLGFDSIYYDEKDNAVYHQFPLMDSAVLKGRAKIKYVLKGNVFMADKFEQVK